MLDYQYYKMEDSNDKPRILFNLFRNSEKSSDRISQVFQRLNYPLNLGSNVPIVIEENTIVNNKMLSNFTLILPNGPWFVVEYCNMCIESIKSSNSMRKAKEIGVFNVTKKAIYKEYLKEVNSFDLENSSRLAMLVSNKLDTLLYSLKTFEKIISEMNCIIFVDRRIEGNLLFRWLDFLSKHDPRFDWIKAGFVYGCNTRSMEHPRLDTPTADLHSRFEDKTLNILVATSDCKGGYDIPICNVVIRYDFPENYQRFCQSTRCARGSFSLFMMDENEENKHRAQLQKWQQLEPKNSSPLQMDPKKDLVSDQSCIQSTMSNQEDTRQMVKTDYSTRYYPVNNYARFFQPTAASEDYFMHELYFESIASNEDLRRLKMIHFEKNKFPVMGLLFQNPLPLDTIESFVFYKTVPIRFRLKINRSYFSFGSNPKSQELLQLIRFYHDHVWRFVIDPQNGRKLEIASPESQFYIVPIEQKKDNTIINFDLIKKLKQFCWDFQANQVAPFDVTEAEIANVSGPDYQQLYLMPHTQSFVHFYRKDMSEVKPIEEFAERTGGKITFEKYYQSKYGIHLKNVDSRLMHMGVARKFFHNFSVYTNCPKKEKMSEGMHNLYPLELLLKYPLDGFTFQMLLAIPYVVYRVEQICCSHDFLVNMAQECNWIKLNFSSDFKGESILEKPLDSELKMVDFELKKEEIEMVNSSQLTSEYLDVLRMQTLESHIGYGEATLCQYVGNIEPHIEMFFDTFDQIKCPHPMQILQALTLSKIDDLWSLEQMETIGDAFIKMTTALYLYFEHPEYDEGMLTSLKCAMVSNKNLFDLAIEKQLYRWIFGQLFEYKHSWFPPAYRKERDKVELQLLRMKDIADCVEALIGCFLIHGGGGTGLRFLDWLGLKAFDPLNTPTIDLRPVYQTNIASNVISHIDFEGDVEWQDTEEVIASTLSFPNMKTLIKNAYHSSQMEEVEQTIGYTFNEKYFLVQALTHPSFSYPEKLDSVPSYQRLEFIGDAILDYMITHVIYLKNKWLNPGQITDLRSALVNNVFYASIAVKIGLHRHLRYSSHELLPGISGFLKATKEKFYQKFGNVTLPNSIEEVEAPKALGDIFESLVGAIFLDCKYSFDKLWRVIYPLIKIEFDYFLKNPPLMPIAALERQFQCNYGNYNEELNQICLRIKKKRFFGKGINKRLAKISAAKKALDYFRELKNPSSANDYFSISHDEDNEDDIMTMICPNEQDHF